MRLKSLILFLLLLFGWYGVYSQPITIKGEVVDENNEPAPSVTVRTKIEPPKVTVTDDDGTFAISANIGDILIFSYMGYKTVELPASANMHVKLEPDMIFLDDVVVVGYMSRKVANTSASVVKVGAAQLTNKPVANPLDAVQGKVTGLQVYSSSGEPSTQLSMALHGQGSLGAGTAPLVIMDGMPVSMGTVQAMNPNDIESIQFLKDAAATSIYGARAANGVMYIVTKRGKINERANILVRAQYGVSSLANTDYFEQLMTGPELLQYYLQTGLYTKDEVDNFRENIFKGTDFSWYKYIYQPAAMYSADASISGGNGSTSYYISGGALSQDGLRMGSSYKKAFARINLNTVLNKYIKAGLNASASYDETRRSPFSDKNVTGGGLAAMNPPFISPYDSDTGLELDYIPMLGITTPKHVIATNPSSSNTFILSANANLTIEPIKNLIIRSLAGLETSYGTGTSRILPSYRNAYGIGYSSRSYGGLTNFSTTNTVSYLMNFGKHNLTALLGHEYINYKDDNFSAGGNGLLDDRLVLLNNVSDEYRLSESGLSYAFLSFFSQISYDFNEKYFLDVVLRNDASSRFGKNNRNGLFWSVGLLWKAKKEDFLKNVSWLDLLDIKASYGTQGNSSIPPYAIESYAGKVGQKKGSMSMGFISYGNQDLGWERQSKFTVGAKARLWNKVEVNIEYYHRLTSDMLFEVPLSYSTGLPIGNLGFVTRYDNVGKYLNQGIDLQLRADIISKKDYGVAAYVNFSYNRDKVVELFDGRDTWYEPGSQLGYIVGKPITYIVPIYKGINTQNGKPEWYVPGSDISVATRNDENVTSEWSSKLEQNSGVSVYTPMTGGWGLEAMWKGFYMNADFSFALGKHMLSLDKQYYENDYHVRDKDANFNASKKLFNYWKEPGDNAEFPSLEYVRSNNHQSTYLDTKMLENASFMRLKNFTIGYQIPSNRMGKQNIITSAKIYFAGRNLLTWTKFRGIDPEVNQSISFGANPNTKQFSIGIELGF